MSWSKSFKWENGSLVDNGVLSSATPTRETLEQLDAAKNAATAIIISGVVGAVGEKYNVSLTGHSNPGHEKTPGWSNDSVVINIYQV